MGRTRGSISHRILIHEKTCRGARDRRRPAGCGPSSWGKAGGSTTSKALLGPENIRVSSASLDSMSVLACPASGGADVVRAVKKLTQTQGLWAFKASGAVCTVDVANRVWPMGSWPLWAPALKRPMLACFRAVGLFREGITVAPMSDTWLRQHDRTSGRYGSL